MFESVKKALFGSASSAGAKSDESDSARVATPSDVEETGGLSSGIGSVADTAHPPEGDETEKLDGAANEGSVREASSDEEKPDLGRSDVEGSEQDDIEVEVTEESAEATGLDSSGLDSGRVAEPAAGGESEVDKAKAEAAENYDKYIRAVAELENYKKRALRERADVLRYAGESLARDMLEIADHLQRALAQDMDGVRDDFVKGLQLILDRFQAIMEQHQVRGESAVGTAFDPVKHEALASVPTADHPAGTVLEEFKRAYYFKDKLLRPAQVVVAKDDEPAAE